MSCHTIKYQIIPYYTKYHKIWNSYNSASFQVRSSKFCMVVYLDNTHILYHTIPYQTIPNYTKYYQIWNSYNFASFQVRSSKFYMAIDLDNTHILYHIILYCTIPNYTLLYQTIPNTSKFEIAITWPVFKLRVPNLAW